MKLHIIEGNTQKLDGGAMFGNAPKALWTRWVTPDDLNRINMACRCLLMTTDSGQHILFETGIGNFFEPKLKDRYGVQESEHKLLEGLSHLGLGPDDIDMVVLSHLHFDHAGGLLSSFEEDISLHLLFKHARIVVGREQWLHALSPHSRDKASYLPILHEKLIEQDQLLLVDSRNQHLILPGLSFSFSHGHTPGLMLAEIEVEQGVIVFTSDLVPGQHWVHLPICMGYDRFPELIIDEKQALYERLLKQYDNVNLFFTHDDQLACAQLIQDDNGRYGINKAACHQANALFEQD